VSEGRRFRLKVHGEVSMVKWVSSKRVPAEPCLEKKSQKKALLRVYRESSASRLEDESSPKTARTLAWHVSFEKGRLAEGPLRKFLPVLRPLRDGLRRLGQQGKKFSRRLVALTFLLLPSTARSWHVYAKALLNEGNEEAALKAWRTAFALDPESPKIGLALIRLLMRLGNYGEADETATSLLRRNPSHIEVLQLRANSRAQQGNVNGAEDDWNMVASLARAALEKRPDPHLYNLAGEALLSLNKAEAAESLMRDGIARCADHGQLAHLLAQAYVSQNRRGDAIRAWQLALSRHPHDAIISAALMSHLLSWSGSTRIVSLSADEIAIFARVLSADCPTSEVIIKSLEEGQDAALAAWVNSARAGLWSLGRAAYVEHLAQLLKILRRMGLTQLIIDIASEDKVLLSNKGRTPHVDMAVNVLFSALLEEEQLARARELLETIGINSPDSENHQTMIAQLLFAEGNYEECSRFCRSLANRFPRSLKVHHMVARTLKAKRAYPEIEKYVREQESEGFLNEMQLGRLAAASGEVILADEYFRRSLKLGTTAVRAYSQFLYTTGRWPEIIALEVSNPHSFAEDQSLRVTLDKVKSLSKTLKLEESTKEGDKDARAEVYEEILRRAPHSAGRSDQRPKVAIVIGTLGPGGAEQQCAVLCQQLVRHAAEGRISEIKLFVSNLTRRQRNAFMQKEIESLGISVVEFAKPAKLLAREVIDDPDIAALAELLVPVSRRQPALRLYNKLRKFNPDIIHAFLDNAIYAAGFATALLPKARLVGRWGSLPPTVQRISSPQERSHANVIREAYRSLMKHTKVQFYSNSRLASDFYADWIGVPHSEILAIKNGIDFSKFGRSEDARQRIRTQLGISPDAVVIGTAIRLGSEKRPSMWLDIADRVAARCKGVEFLIVGDGPLIDEVKSKAETLVHAKVHIVGRQSNIADWYSAMDVTLMTSSVEGLSNTVLESLYMGMPVVAFDVGGMSEAIVDGESGFLFQEGNIDGISSALVRLVTEPETRARMGAKAHDYTSKNFDPEKMCESVLAVYEDLLQR
jgi:glycosyltransferase involved in cell wall biosynthesis/predicted Zn-dependent protease